MLPVSPRWAKTLSSSHGLAAKVDVLYGGVVTAEDIPFVDGAVTVDRGSDVRRSLTLTIADPRSFPVLPTDTFAVYGQQLYVERGIRYLDGSEELLPQGFFVITEVSGDIHYGPINISALGQEILLKRAVVGSATSTTGYATTTAFISAMIQQAIPGASYVNASTTGGASIPTKTWEAGTDYWQIVSEAATAIGAEIYCDNAGTFRLSDIPDPEVILSPDWEVKAGEGGVMVSAEMSLSADGVYNRVVVTGENSADNKPPVSGTATITDVSDPLRYGGPFGQVTRFVSSSLVTTGTAATSMANALLRNGRAPNRTVSVSAVPNPALDAGDRIGVHYGPGIDPEIHVVQSFSLPLSVTGSASAIETVSGKADES